MNSLTFNTEKARAWHEGRKMIIKYKGAKDPINKQIIFNRLGTIKDMQNEIREALKKDFPAGTKIAFEWSKGEAIGVCTGHYYIEGSTVEVNVEFENSKRGFRRLIDINFINTILREVEG